jgi:hypothetical protein
MFDPEYGYIDDAVLARANEAPDTAIPSDLDEMPPGTILAAIIECTDIETLSGHDRIIFLRAQQRMASHYNAGVYRAMAAVTEHMRDSDPFSDHTFATEAAAAEIRAALRLTRRATDSELSFALELRERLPAVFAALRSGDGHRAGTPVDYRATRRPFEAALYRSGPTRSPKPLPESNRRPPHPRHTQY